MATSIVISCAHSFMLAMQVSIKYCRWELFVQGMRGRAALYRLCCRQRDPGVCSRSRNGFGGQSLGPGIVLDFSRYMRRILHVDAANKTVCVQPGVVLAELNRVLATHDCLFGPDPATRSVTTLGSAISVDTSGSHWPRYGSVSSAVLGVEAILANGEQVRLGKSSWMAPDHDSPTVRKLQGEIGQLLEANRDIVQNPPWSNTARGCGYRLEQAIDGDQIDLAKLQAGAEGTLAILTEATLRIEQMPAARAVVLLFFDRLDGAAKAAIEARKDHVAACDMMDRRLLEIARETDPRYERIVPRGSEAMLLIEQQGKIPQKFAVD